MTTLHVSQRPPNDPSAAEEVAARIFEACGGAFELLTVWLGDHLGLYAAINEAPETTATELAERCRLDARYVQEWCDQQAIAGLLTCAGTPRRYTLAAGVREALLDPLCRSYVAPMTVLPRSVVRVLPLLLEAFVTGAGVPYAEYGRDAVEAQAALNRPWSLMPCRPSGYPRSQASRPDYGTSSIRPWWPIWVAASEGPASRSRRLTRGSLSMATTRTRTPSCLGRPWSPAAHSPTACSSTTSTASNSTASSTLFCSA